MVPNFTGESAFTLLEIMAVLVVLALFVGVVAVNFDLFGLQAENELEQFVALVRSEQLWSVAKGRRVRVRFSPGKEAVKFIRNSGGEVEFLFSSLRLEEPPNKFALKIAPTNVSGPEEIVLTAKNERYVFVPDRILGLRRIEEPGGKNN